MNKNESMSRNQINLSISRSVFDWHIKRAGTCDAGLLVPIFTYTDVLPGDQFTIRYKGLVRGTTPVCPVMDDLYADISFFYVPNRILLSRESFTNDKSVASALRSWKYFLGAQDNLLNMPLPASEDDRTLPCLGLSATKAPLQSLWDYQGNSLQYVYPSGSDLDFPVNPFWALSYYAVWNDFYRDPNFMDPVTWGVDEDTGFTGNPRVFIHYNVFAGVGPEGSHTGGGDTSSTAELGLACVSPFHGYFGSALPWPQRNAAGIPAGLLDGYAPILGQGDLTPSYSTKGTGARTFPVLYTDKAMLNPILTSYTGNISGNTGSLAAQQVDVTPQVTPDIVTKWNLKADLSDVAMANINDLRMAFAEQRFYEALARSGNRYNEMLMGIYGVNRGPEDGPEFLGSQRVMLNINQVNATAGGSGAPTLGSTGAFSLTSFGENFAIRKASLEHGTILACMVIRPNDTFSQGLPKAYQRYKFFDYYLPQFAHIGEQPIYESELYLGDSAVKESSLAKVFGYQEYAAEYRMIENKVCGHLRPGEDMGYWTYGNNFDKAPTLVDFMDGRRFKNNVDQTLQVSSKTAGFQFMYDFSFEIQAIRPMPSNSIPGLIDHH